MALNYIFEKIKDDFSEGSSCKCIAAAQWCFKRNLFQQSVTFLREGIISFFCEKHGIGPEDIDNRELVSTALSICADDIPESKWIVDANKRSLLDVLLQDQELCDATIIQEYKVVRDARNDFNHAGFRKNAMRRSKLIATIERALEFFGARLNSSNSVEYKQKLTKMLVNVSNHPVGEWSKEQRDAARKEYGEVVDWPFPAIDGAASTDDIEKLAKKTAKELLKSYDDTVDLTVHVMGEMTFTYSLVSQLKTCGIRCVASTTARETENLGNGDKLSHFRFVRFREY